MKKFVIFTASLLASLFILSACGNGDIQVDEEKTEVLVGVLTEQSSTDTLKGTHILTTDAEKEVAARSLSLNLSSSRYLDNKVQATGFFNPDDDVFEITGISIIEDEKKTKDEDKEVELIDYKNSDLGFELKDYSDWEVDESSDGVIFTAPDLEDTGEDTDVVKISQFPFDYSPTISEVDGSVDTPLVAFMNQYYPGEADYSSNKIGVDNLEAIELESGDEVKYFMYRNGLIYSFVFSPKSDNAENGNIFNEMIRSFRFIGFTADEVDGEIPDAEELIPGEEGEEEEVAAMNYAELPDPGVNFTTFESLPFHFSAQYPAGWYYAGSSSSDSNVRHHYGFREDADEDSQEVVSMDVFTGGIPAGQSVKLGNIEANRVASGGRVSFYITVDGQSYHVSGDSGHEEIMMVMASSIVPVEGDGE